MNPVDDLVEVDGAMLRHDKVVWVVFHPCGHGHSLLLGEYANDAEEAFEHLAGIAQAGDPTADRWRAEGHTCRPVAFTDYRANPAAYLMTRDEHRAAHAAQTGGTP